MMNTIIAVLATVGLCALAGLLIFVSIRLVEFIHNVSMSKRVIPALKEENASLRRQLADSEARKESFKATMLANEKTCTCRPITDGSYRNKQNPDPIPYFHTEPLRGKS